MFSFLTKIPKAAIINGFKRGASDAVQTRMNTEKCMNEVMILGRVGNDPLIKGNEQNPVVTFSVATSYKFRGEEGQYKSATDWHRVSVFKPYIRDSVTKYVQRGTRLLITGRIAYGQIVDAHGSIHTTTSIVAEKVVYLANTKSGEEAVDLEDEIHEESLQH